MTIVYATPTKSSRMNAVVADIGAAGKLKLWSAADVLLATYTLATPAGTVTNGVITLSDANGGTAGILSTNASASGTATKASITTAGDVTVITNAMTVGTSGADLIIDNPVLTAGQASQINSGTITHA